MAEVKANAAICEICGGKLVFRNADNFECESCGANYPKDWVKAKVQEIIGTVRVEGAVEVSGVESADALYKRALDWLGLQDKTNAIKVLQEMTEKYPGDKRGWLKLARIHPSERTFNVARQFEADEIKKIEEEHLARAQIICDKIRNGKIGKIEDEFIKGYDDFRLIPTEWAGNRLYFTNLPCYKDLLAEGRENADLFDGLYKNTISSSYLSEGLEDLLGKFVDEGFKIYTDKFRKASFWIGGGSSNVSFIIGNLLIIKQFDYEGDDYYVFKTKNVLSKSFLQQVFSELHNWRMNNLCVKCGSIRKSSFWSGTYCPRCDKR